MRDVITIVVVDDHDVIRSGLVACLSAEDDFQVIGEGRSAADACRLVRELSPRVALLDINMPGGGIDAAREITATGSKTAVVMFSFRDDESMRAKAQEAGAAAYLVKGISGAELARALRATVSGRE